ncbi:MAG: tRNA (adenosine(37)-N6)-threonylcarbamoyltransferase complex dimerization subunit type 1 TsaB [Bdellovibrio sp.]|nr:MAG: tRNA (adenosine(37)-N6)-threonylcarbamoyltransferase complex dimerization subunit type 1 TsaB [Bdellovibrio sp.]
MIVLSVETSTPLGSLAIGQVNKNSCQVMASLQWEKKSSHSELITLYLQKALSQAHLSLHQIEALSLGNGPGSFTGLRVAVNFIRSLSYALNKPIYPFSSLELLHSPLSSTNYTLCTLKAFRNLIYFSLYPPQDTKPLLPPQAQTFEDFFKLLATYQSQNLTCVGNLNGLIKSQLPYQTNWTFIDRTPMAEHALERLSKPPCPPPLKWNELKPLYIRASEAEEKAKSQTQ